MATRRRVLHCTWLLALLSIAGCGAESTDQSTYPVTGVVTEGGQPVAGALVQFHPTGDGSAPLPAGSTAIGGQATTAEDGSYSVQCTFDKGKTTVDGVPAGSYAVTVAKVEAPPGGPSRERPPRNILDPQYATIERTPVKATVNQDGENKVDVSM